VTPSDRLRRLWRPPADTIAGVAAVLREHWRAAAGMRPVRLFWPTPGRWLKVPPAVSVSPASVPPVTTSPGVAGSSDKLPDPHP
jgi:hypothetical protein